MTARVNLVEVGPRDGLQNQKTIISTAQKVALVNALSKSGLERIEVTSFVSPKWVPQLADAADVMTSMMRSSGVRYCVLTPNLKGMERALAVRPDEIAIFTSASEGFCQHNMNCAIKDSLSQFEPVIDLANENAIPVRGYVSCAIDCPYDGPIKPHQVSHVAAALQALGCYEISLGDTIGSGTPEKIKQMLDAVLTLVPAEKLAGHYHNTNGQALENIKVSLDKGLRNFDSAIGGLGGCPYAPGAKGNVATEHLVSWLHAAGFDTGIDLQTLTELALPLANSMKGA